MIHCYLSQISYNWEAEDNTLVRFVSPERQQKIARYYHKSDKKLCLYAGLITRYGLSSISGQPLSNLSFLYKQHYKPLFLSDSKYDFNISHSDKFVLCCISCDTPVGADVSKINIAPFEIMPLVFHSKEIAYIESASPTQKSTLFYKIWTQKEAYTKYLGTGLVYNTANCNILSSCYSNLLYTWQQKNYICCICGKQPNNHTIIELSEKEIKSKFLSQ